MGTKKQKLESVPSIIILFSGYTSYLIHDGTQPKFKKYFLTDSFAVILRKAKSQLNNQINFFIT